MYMSYCFYAKNVFEKNLSLPSPYCNVGSTIAPLTYKMSVLFWLLLFTCTYGTFNLYKYILGVGTGQNFWLRGGLGQSESGAGWVRAGCGL